MKLKIGSICLAAFLSTAANAEPVQSVEIIGNQRVETESVRSYLAVKEGEELTAVGVNQSIKTLFATGLFSDVSARISGGNVEFEVVENPIISQVAFEGNKAIDDNKLRPEVTLDTRSIYTKSEVQKNVQRIADIYKKSGRFNATVEPKVILKEQNRVDLIFEINEGETTAINRIIFLGNGAFDDDDLREVVHSEESAWYNLLSSNDVYDADRIEFDKELLRRHYTKNGYADFAVNAAVAELTPDDGGFIVTFSVDEGDLYTFNKIQTITQLDEVDPSKFDDDVVLTRTEEIYDASRVERTVDNIVEQAGEKGYAFVEVEPQVSRDTDNNTIDITYVVKEGPKVYVDRINIGGNVRTLDKVIRREMKLAEGDPFNTSSLKRSKQRIQNLNFFGNVEVTQERADVDDKVNIDVKVVEQSTGELNFGAGFSSIDGVLGEISVQERNLLGRGQRLKASLTASGVRQQGVLAFTEPYFMDRNIAAGFEIFRTERDFQSESSYRSQSNGVRLNAGYEISEYLRHSINYSIIEDDISDVDNNASLFIRRQEGVNVTSMLGHSFVYDKRDSSQDPKDGYFFRLGQDFAGIGGDNHFVRHDLTAAYYLPITEDKDWNVLFALSAGNVTGIDDNVPINHRFYLGGKDFRGFERAGIGPRDSATEDALGGNNFYAFTTELRFPLKVSEEYGFTGALFADAGSLWDVDESGAGIIDSQDPRVTLGVGLGWNSPFGPLRLDFGFPVVKDDADITETFQLNFGTRF